MCTYTFIYRYVYIPENDMYIYRERDGPSSSSRERLSRSRAAYWRVMSPTSTTPSSFSSSCWKMKSTTSPSEGFEIYRL